MHLPAVLLKGLFSCLDRSISYSAHALSARPLSYSSSFNQDTPVQSNNHSHLIHDHCFPLESGHMVANYESRLPFIEQDHVLAEYND